ncbi:polysaccharide deacetylase family protein [Streptomyces sp. SP17BM10]|uniref:polysaccharide deacetylase family protein n=1 Tax=Streptomyces sp. SP17BM10 TaxID=3002530 RepID=UPI002E7857C8|nr:polysaccharide deacetylase family protein [Streptomyces sp. SP17BM10]MEE1785008.1 polysaccharide deacetylase family protein [Streptomyces sp. SP17BM10]
MSQPAARRPASPNRSARLRRQLIMGSAAVVAALGLAACGTASGALQPGASPSAQGTITISPTTAPAPTTPGTPGSDAPGSDGVPVTAAAASPAAPPVTPRTPRTPGNTPGTSPSTANTSTANTSTSSPSTAAGAPAAPAAPISATTVIGSTASGGRTVALTFDDGPGPATPQILDLLAQYNVKATFCEIGQNAAANPAMVKKVLAAGHRLCDHSVHHPQPFQKLPHDKAVAEIAGAKDMIVKAGGPGTQVTWFRAPGGGFNADNEHIAAGLGMKSLGWSVDPRDWSRPGVPAIVSTVQGQLRPGGVILMHDGGGDRSQTVAALKQLLPWLVAQGYTFDFPAA